MSDNSTQVPWTDEQWAQVRQVIAEEAQRARVAAGFLPLVGPLPPSSDFVRADTMDYGSPSTPGQRMTIDDTSTILLPTLQVKVWVRGAQMADPELTSALQLFRRAANVLARLEDAVIFNGQEGPNKGPANKNAIEGLPGIWEILGGEQSNGLLNGAAPPPLTTMATGPDLGEELVARVSEAIGRLERAGHFGPFAVVLDHVFFTAAQTPNASSLVLPQDRIIPFLGGGPLLRSSTLPERTGVVVALGAAPVELVVATDVELNFLQVTLDPRFVFRVYEKVRLRIKECNAIVALTGQ
ncbi:MAG: family 1 encapsulin nanocompartment shell protein [Thiohalocapsa sp.]|jgi:uncharacterized linocin/CFP29 family protein